MSAAEEARAAQWCADQRARVAAQKARDRQLAGSASAYAALVANWQPIIDRNEGDICNGRYEEPRDSDQQANG
jgi:hypothetical protein